MSGSRVLYGEPRAEELPSAVVAHADYEYETNGSL